MSSYKKISELVPNKLYRTTRFNLFKFKPSLLTPDVVMEYKIPVKTMFQYLGDNRVMLTYNTMLLIGWFEPDENHKDQLCQEME